MHDRQMRVRRARRDDGGVTVFVAVCVLALISIIGLAVDGGAKMAATERADYVAGEAARAGGQAIDPAQAITGQAITVDPQDATAAAQARPLAAGRQRLQRCNRTDVSDAGSPAPSDPPSADRQPRGAWAVRPCGVRPRLVRHSLCTGRFLRSRTPDTHFGTRPHHERIALDKTQHPRRRCRAICVSRVAP